MNHYHKAAELILVTRGKVQVMSGTSLFTCRRGDMIFVPSLSVHEVLGLTEDAHIRGVIFEYSLLETGSIDIDFRELFHSRQRLYPVISPEHPCYKELREAYEHLITAYEALCIPAAEEVPAAAKDSVGIPPAPQPLTAGAKMQLTSYLLLITSWLLHIFSLEEQATDKNQTRLSPVFQYIEAHFTEKIRISDLSSLLYTCDDQLIRLFKTVTGETPMEYIMNMRVESAMKLLTSTDRSISEIAEQTGFGTANYMTRLFRRKLHRTPGSYRNSRTHHA